MVRALYSIPKALVNLGFLRLWDCHPEGLGFISSRIVGGLLAGLARFFMSQRKLAVFTILAIISLFCAKRVLDLRTERRDLVKPHSWSDIVELDANEPLSYLQRRAKSPVHPLMDRARADLAGAAVLPIQSKNPDDIGLGKLLVASRDLADPSFAKTVVLLVQYDTKGVIGLMINRRTHLPLSRVFNELKSAKDLSDPVYAGGPVDIPAVFALLHSPSKIEGAEQIVGGIYLISAKSQFEQILSKRPDPAIFHVYLGYAGWTPEQLRQEIKLGAWFIFQGDTQTVFNADPDSVWLQMIRQTEFKLAKGAYKTTDDPS
jgi:putative transcriptional regulator